MITNKGKDIIGKYLLGQAPAYASYIAVGCGAKPLEPYVSGAIPDYSAKKTLDFEMFRIPISSRGFIDDDGVSKIVLTGELPTEERYEITEVGIFSAKSNSLKLISVKFSTSSPPSKNRGLLPPDLGLYLATQACNILSFIFSERVFGDLSTNPGTAPFLKKLSWKSLIFVNNCIVLKAGFNLGTPL